MYNFSVDNNYFVSKMSEAEIKIYLLEAREEKNSFEYGTRIVIRINRSSIKCIKPLKTRKE